MELKFCGQESWYWLKQKNNKLNHILKTTGIAVSGSLLSNSVGASIDGK